jgi:hypothetical protein
MPLALKYPLIDLQILADALPEEGNGEWKLKVTVEVVGHGDPYVSRVNILGPGDKFVGECTGKFGFRPSSSCSYWYIKQMLDTGWVEGPMLEKQ